MTDKSAIVIGAGVAGITAAVKLADAGYRVTLLESGKRIGGRIASFEDEKTREVIDYGQHVLIGAYKDFLALINKLGTSHLLYKKRNTDIPFYNKGGKSYRLYSNQFPGKAGLLIALMKIPGMNTSVFSGILKLYRQIKFNSLFTKDLTAFDILDKFGQNYDVITNFWEPLVISTMNTELKNAPAVIFEAVLREGLFSGASKSRLIFPADGLGELIAPIDSYLSNRGGELIAGNLVKDIEIENRRVSFITTNNNEQLAATAYILAAAPESVRKLTYRNVNEIADIAGKFNSSSILSVYLWYDSEVMDIEYMGVLNSPVHWIFNRRLLCKSDDKLKKSYPGHITLTVSAANIFRNLNEGQIIEMVINELLEVLPKTKDAELLHYRVINYAKATIELNNENEELRPDNTTRIKNLFLAGDWTKTGLPATIEGAAKSGNEAAERIIETFV